MAKVQAVQNYIQNDLTADFDKVVNVIKSQIRKVEEQVKEQEKKGLIIKDRAIRLEKIKLKELEVELKDKEKLDKEQLGVEKETRTEKAKTTYQRAYDYIVDLVARVFFPFRKLFGLVPAKSAGTKKMQKVEDIKPQETVGHISAN